MKNLKFSLPLAALFTGLALTGLAEERSTTTSAAALAAAVPETPTAPAAVPTVPDAGTIRSAIDLFRADLQHEKAVVIAEMLPLTPDESSEFWPLYNEYNAAYARLLDDRLVLLKDYVGSYDTMTDDQATALAGKVFDWEGKRTALKREWFKKFSEVVPPKKAAQFFQIDNQINAALDLRLMDALPLIK